MNDFAREVAGAFPEYHEALKRMPEFQQDDKRLDRLRKFKRSQKRSNVKPKVSPKLSFEISLDEIDEVMKHPAMNAELKERIKKPKNGKNNATIKQTKKVIPKKFIAHIVKLGFNATDAARLYESKDDWLGLSGGDRILCTQKGCKFTTTLSGDFMFEHCRSVHGWRDYPCTHDNCDFIAYSSTSQKSHVAKFHSPYRTHNGNYYSCPRPKCTSAFTSNAKLIVHERTHSNDLFRCVFCSYGNAHQHHLFAHQRSHFNTRNYKCNVCEKAFLTGGSLNEHIKLKHESDEAETKCPLCDRIGNRKIIQNHLGQKHNVTGLKWDERQKQYIVPQQI